MPESFDLLNVPFATADASRLVLSYEQGQLRVSFVDWQEQSVILLFRDVAGFSWDDGEASQSAAHRDDTSYTIAGSDWLRQQLDIGTITVSEGHHHFKLCFNAVGVLQVISTGLETLTEA
jgi:hypothetical protein